MTDFKAIPVDCREVYARLVAELVTIFYIDKRSGRAIVNFKEGIPMDIEPSPRISLSKQAGKT